jgi:hypothetical protein
MQEKKEHEARDTGMAMVLICLLAMLVLGPEGWLPTAIILLVLTMTWPKLFKPLAVFWFGLSHRLGGLVSKLILTLLFFCVVLPIALIRRMLGADPLQLKWRQKKESVGDFSKCVKNSGCCRSFSPWSCSEH